MLCGELNAEGGNMHERFDKRTHAGWCVGQCLKFKTLPQDVITVGIARGGVPIAAEVATVLGTPLDILVVAKLRMPELPRLSIGAVTGGGEFVLDNDLIRYSGLTERRIQQILGAEKSNAAERDRFYRRVHGAGDWARRTVLLVDDGMVQGLTMLAAIKEARRRGADRVIVCVPVASFQAAESVRKAADDVLCLRLLEPFGSIDEWYSEYPRLTDAEAKSILDRVTDAAPEKAACCAA
jgi:putative phosphoribosyl transferase